MNKKIIFGFFIALVFLGGIVWFIQNKMGVEQSVNEDKNASEEANTESVVRTQREDNVVDTSDWLIEKNDAVDFSFKHPQKAKIIDERNCYRVEYELGFVIFFLPVDGDMRCGARTGVGVLPDNVDVTDYLTIGGERYEAPGFEATVDTKGERFFKPDTRYFYDFHHMCDLNKEKNCGNASGCRRVAYGIYKEVSTPLSKEDIDSTMNTLRAIIESVNVPTPKQ